jgi:hypothetical protein
MDQATAFHRSFLDASHLGKLSSVNETLYVRIPLKDSVEGYLRLSGAYRALDLLPKRNQDFSSYATEWERAGSILCQGVWGRHLTRWLARTLTSVTLSSATRDRTGRQNRH